MKTIYITKEQMIERLNQASVHAHRINWKRIIANRKRYQFWNITEDIRYIYLKNTCENKKETKAKNNDGRPEEIKDLSGIHSVV